MHRWGHAFLGFSADNNNIFLSLHLKCGPAPLSASRARLTVVTRDLLGAATSCEAPPERASPTFSAEKNAMEPWPCSSLSHSPPGEKKTTTTVAFKFCSIRRLVETQQPPAPPRNDVDPGSHHRREGDANRGGSVSADQNWVFTVENPGHLQREPPSAASVLPGEAGKCSPTFCAVPLCSGGSVWGFFFAGFGAGGLLMFRTRSGFLFW